MSEQEQEQENFPLEIVYFENMDNPSPDNVVETGVSISHQQIKNMAESVGERAVAVAPYLFPHIVMNELISVHEDEVSVAVSAKDRNAYRPGKWTIVEGPLVEAIKAATEKL